MSRILLDAGALIALDRDQPSMWRRLLLARRGDGLSMLTHGGVVGQVWRHASRQARLAQALRAIDIKPLDESLGKQAGVLLARTRTSDVIDAALVSLSRPGDRIFTSDPDDLSVLVVAAGIDVEIVPV